MNVDFFSDKTIPVVLSINFFVSVTQPAMVGPDRKMTNNNRTD